MPAAWVSACLLAAGCGPVRLTLDDAIVSPRGTTIRCSASVEQEYWGGLRTDINGTQVAFFADGRPLGSAVTRGGAATRELPLPRDGAVRIEAECIAGGRRLRATAHVYTFDPRRVIIAVDIDNTISSTDYKELYRKPEDEESEPKKGSRRTLARLKSDYDIAYVTARPRLVLDKTRQWLHEEEFPSGPVICAPGLREALRRTSFKRQVLTELRQRWPNLLIGIGNSESDVEAYSECDMLPVIVFGKPSRAAERIHAVPLRHWKDVARFFADNAGVLAEPERLRRHLAEDPDHRALRAERR